MSGSMSAMRNFVATCAVAFVAIASHAQPAELQEANRLLKSGQTQQALDRANAYLNGKPKDAVARFIKGIAQSELGKTNDAIMTFQGLTEDYPELPEPYNNLAVLYSSKGQFEKARVALELAIQTHPSYATAHENLGDIYAKLASQAYDKALQLDKANNTAATKLNLVRDLFSTNPKANTAPRVTAASIPTTNVAAGVPPAAAIPKATAPVFVPPPATPNPAPNTATTAAAATAAAPPKATAPATPPAAAAAAIDARADVLASVNRWAKAWSSRNADAYLANYAKTFTPDNRQSRAAWAAARKERVSTPKKINVQVVDPVIEMVSPNEARVVFRQNYESDTLNTRSRKTLTLVREDGDWRISRERSG